MMLCYIGMIFISICLVILSYKVDKLEGRNEVND